MQDQFSTKSEDQARLEKRRAISLKSYHKNKEANRAKTNAAAKRFCEKNRSIVNARSVAYAKRKRPQINLRRRTLYYQRNPGSRPQPPKLSEEERKAKRKESKARYLERHKESLQRKREAQRRAAGKPKRKKLSKDAISKVCPKCKIDKMMDRFCISTKSRDGRSNRCQECIRQWYLDHPSYGQDRYQRTKEKLREERKIQYKLNPEYFKNLARKRRVLKKDVGGEHTESEWEAVCAKFGNRCVCCGTHSSIRPLTRDHIVPITHRLSSDSIENIQPLCRQCNCRKYKTHSTDYRGSPFTGKGQLRMF